MTEGRITLLYKGKGLDRALPSQLQADAAQHGREDLPYQEVMSQPLCAAQEAGMLSKSRVTKLAASEVLLRE